MPNVAAAPPIINFQRWSARVDGRARPVAIVPAPRPARDWVLIPREAASPMMLAAIMGVSTRAILYWRRGQRRPRWRH